MRRVTIVLSILGSAVIASADVVHLNDGTTVEGIVRRSDDGWVVTANGKSTTIPADQVASIEMKAAAGADARLAAERLASLRRAVQNSDNLPDIIARFQRFVDTTTDPTAVASAKKDLAQWQDRSAQHMVKAGGNWVLPEAVAGLVDASQSLTIQAHDLLMQGKMNEAEPLLVQAVADDAHNAGAQYLLGVLRYTQETIPAARTAFTAAIAAAPDDAASLNNLAVVLWRQRQFLPAMTNYDSAMQALRVNKFILDNVAAALADLPMEFRQSPVVSKARRHFNEQDLILQQQMAKLGLRRSGSTWINEQQAAEIEQQRKAIQDKIDVLSAEYDKQQDAIHQIDVRMASVAATLHQIEANSFTTDSKGTMIAIPYPPQYEEMKQEMNVMAADRQSKAAKLPPLQQQARALQKQLPAGASAVNVQHIVGPEGMPQPTTRPTTRQSQ